VTRRFDFATFDCYGTLVDWEGGIGRALASEAGREGIEVSPSAAFEAYFGAEKEVESGAYRSYRTVLAETAGRAAGALGWTLRPERADALADSLPSWSPFPDTNAALERLAAAGVRLGILSNVDDDLLAGTRRHFTVEFDLVVTAQHVRSYKPAPGHFLAARERIAGASWIHAAQSYFHDVVPARRLGIPSAWINRNGERAGASGPPDVEFRDLAAFAAWMTGAVDGSRLTVEP
jgi:2-haloalkanoic acid dehalogenase type II